MLYAPAADGNVHVLNPSTGAPGTSITPSLPGALTSWIAFGADGGGYVAQGTRMAKTPDTNISYSGTLSPPAVGADTAYVTETDSLVREVQFGWTTPLSGSGCSFKSPVFANGVVYAAGCTSLGAYDAGTGGTLWTVTTSGSSQGLAYANGVLYGCISSRLVAYAASYGGKL
jgi:outer membrane protein assembly factor BamB